MVTEARSDPREELATLIAALGVELERHRVSGTRGLPRSAAPVAAPEPVAAPAIASAREAEASPARAPAPAPVPAAPPLDPAEQKRRLDVIAAEVAACTRCGLHASRTQTVFARGTGSARLCFVGEGPGADEDAQGFPFVGKAGQLLDRMIAAMGFARDDVYVANIVKCLKYTTGVLLENGDWERIGRLVAQKYAGRVMSVAANGALVPKRVTAWYASPLGTRRVYRMSYVGSRLRGGCRATTHLTEDHPVLTRRGWVEARDVRPDDEVAVGQGLSEVALDTVVGSMLGDGTLANQSAFLQIVHSRDQREWAALKGTALGELNPVVYDSMASNQTGRQYLTTVCRTRASRALQVLKNEWYLQGSKRIPLGLRLTPRSFAVWFLDDGYTRVKSHGCAMAEIAAHSFNESELERLRVLLARDLQLDGYRRDSSPGRLHFGAETTLRLSRVVAPYCPPSMRYKLHPAVRDGIPFEPSLFEAGPRFTLFDRVLIAPIEHSGTEKTFFCIDVEDTHNFVTSGGVVHNCRPPNNRKPEPEEMAACVGYLAQQLEIIQPEVIVALGATAVQGLLGTSEGITRLRGKWKLYKGRIAVMPTFHPAYLLRTPSAKRDVWNDLQAVLRQMGRPVPPPKQ